MPGNGNAALVKRVGELISKGEIPDEVTGEVLFAGFIATDAVLQEVSTKVRRLEWVVYGLGPFVAAFVIYVGQLLIKHVLGG